ncbi:hypothetical protein LCGC14_2872540, partial [marine sediment metagenome]
ERSVQPNSSPANRKYITVMERKELLSELAQNGNAKMVSPVEAIKELNRMEGSYAPIKHAVDQRVVFEIVRVDARPLLGDPVDVELSPEVIESTGEAIEEGEGSSDG